MGRRDQGTIFADSSVEWSCGRSPAPQLTSCVTSGKSFNPSEHPFLICNNKAVLQSYFECPGGREHCGGAGFNSFSFQHQHPPNPLRHPRAAGCSFTTSDSSCYFPNILNVGQCRHPHKVGKSGPRIKGLAPSPIKYFPWKCPPITPQL